MAEIARCSASTSTALDMYYICVTDIVVEAMMTRAKIEKEAQRAQIPYQLALQIRQLLDDARKAYGGEAWDGDDMESKVLELVTEE